MSDIHILDHGVPLHLSHAGMLDYHGGGALAGAAIAWRAMEAAALALSRETLWDRRDLRVRIAHDGPGVRDAVEYVTRAITRGSLEIDAATPHLDACASHLAFRFVLWNPGQGVVLQLKPGAVAAEFFETVQALRTQGASPALQRQLVHWKRTVAASVMEQTLDALFDTREAPPRGARPTPCSA